MLRAHSEDASCVMSWFIDLVLHLDKHLVDLLDPVSLLDLRDSVCDHLLRDGPGRHAVPPWRLPAVRRRCARGGGHERHAERARALTSARDRGGTG